jgi:hypothetical protein
MKRTMMSLGILMMMSPAAFAGGAMGKTALQESVKTYSDKVKETAFGKGVASAQGMTELAQKQSQDKLINWLKLDGTEANKLSVAMNMDSAARASRLDTLASIVAVKEMVRGGSVTDPAEAASLDKAATASAKLLVHARLTGKMPVEMVKDLNGAELNDTTLALKKLETLPESILVSFDLKERDSYSEILARHDELTNGNAKSSEENLVQAIMDVKKITKDKALELVRRLKECV